MAGSQTVYWDDITAVPVPPLNGGFETGTLASWNTLVTSSGTVGVGTVAHSGNYGLTETPSNGQDIAYQDISGLIPGQTYIASAWVKATGANTVALVIHDTQGSGLVENTITANTTWQQISQAFVADSTAAMRVHLYAMPGTQTVYWDDVVVTGGVLSPTLGQAFVNVWSNFNGVDLWQNFSVMISGQITSGGSALSGVTVSLTGTASATTTTDTNGDYSFSVPILGSYNVTPSLSGYTFSPGSATFGNLAVNEAADFSGISGSGGGSGGGGGTGGGSGTSGGYDISGTWQQASTFAGTWQLSQNGTYVSGTASSTAGANCGTITWQVSGEIVNSTAGTYSLAATNPSAAEDACGNESASEQLESLALAAGNQTASSIDTSVFSSGNVSGASSWSKGTSPVPVRISGSPGIPYGGYSNYVVTVGSSPVTVTITTTAGDGEAYFLNNSYTEIILSQTTTLEVYGDTVSSTAGNILISVSSNATPSTVLAQLQATVISVSLTLRNTGTWSSDDTAATTTVANFYGSSLGSHVVAPPSGPYCAQVVEYMGTVVPANYQGVIGLLRTKNTAIFDNQTQYGSSSGNDNSSPGYTVTIPTAQGHIFDIDVPGQYPDATGVTTDIWRARQNYTEYATLDGVPAQGSSAIVLASINTFARTSCTGSTSSPSSGTDLPGDNTSGLGNTALTWNFQ